MTPNDFTVGICECCHERMGVMNLEFIFDNPISDREEGIGDWVCLQCEEEAQKDIFDLPYDDAEE